jgi:hypothetical protein
MTTTSVLSAASVEVAIARRKMQRLAARFPTVVRKGEGEHCHTARRIVVVAVDKFACVANCNGVTKLVVFNVASNF